MSNLFLYLTIELGLASALFAYIAWYNLKKLDAYRLKHGFDRDVESKFHKTSKAIDKQEKSYKRRNKLT